MIDKEWDELEALDRVNKKWKENHKKCKLKSSCLRRRDGISCAFCENESFYDKINEFDRKIIRNIGKNLKWIEIEE